MRGSFPNNTIFEKLNENLLFSQISPLYPFLHVHTEPPFMSFVHVPPFWHSSGIITHGKALKSRDLISNFFYQKNDFFSFTHLFHTYFPCIRLHMCTQNRPDYRSCILLHYIVYCLDRMARLWLKNLKFKNPNIKE